MRDAQQAANREKFHAVAAEPLSFSQVQMQTYLKRSLFKQQIEAYKQAIGGGGSGSSVLGEDGETLEGVQVRQLVSVLQYCRLDCCDGVGMAASCLLCAVLRAVCIRNGAASVSLC